MTTFLIILAAWVLLAFVVGVVVGHILNRQSEFCVPSGRERVGMGERS